MQYTQVVKLEADSIRNYAIGTLTIALLISLGFNIQPEDNYFCRELEISKYCNRLSSTENTCYPLPNVRTGSKFCSSGWEEIIKESLERLPQTADSLNIGTVWECSHSGCIRIK